MGLIKQRGVTKIYMEIGVPEFEDICEEGNIVIIEDGMFNKRIPTVVLSDFIGNKDKLPPKGKLLVQMDGKSWWTMQWEKNFPKQILYVGGGTIVSKIYSVFKTPVEPKSIKTLKDIQSVLKDFIKRFPKFVKN